MYRENRRNSGTRFVLTALRRGLSRRCPHCGRGPLFSGWGRHLDCCSHCGLVYERNAGDTWFFTIIGDRVPVAIGVVLVYFGVSRAHRALGIAIFVVMIALLVWTSPNRWGVGIALHYLSRAFWPDPADPIPDDEARRSA
jgi:uncharacterized protein (DUF983 family)